MRRITGLNILTLLPCLTIAVALGIGCDAKSSKPAGNANTSAGANDNAAKTPTADDADTDKGDDMGADPSMEASNGDDDHDHDHDGHDHGDHDGHDHGSEEASADATPVDDANLVDLSKLNITRHPSGVRPTNKRDATGDMIYATVRVQMDHLIAERKELLDGGMDPTDPEVRQKESSIRKAVSLLTQNGEEVGPIDPPIEGLDLTAGD